MASDEKRSAQAKLLHWIGRVLSLPAVIFAGAHLISPETNPEANVSWVEWLAVGILFLSVLALVLGWWKERLGGWSALGLLVLFWIVYGIYAREFFPAWTILLAGIGLPGAIFLISDFLRARSLNTI